MKMIRILFMFALVFSMSNAFGQIKVMTDGNVGINNTAPTTPLQINSRGQGAAGFLLRTTSTGSNTLFEVQEGGVGAGNFFIYDAAGSRTIQFAGQGKFFIATPGNVGIDQQNPSSDFELGTANGGGGVAAKPGGGPFIATSDMRSKNSVSAYDGGLNTLLKLNPVSYTYNGKFGTPTNGTEYIGLIAQEVKEVAPYMVMDRTYNSATLEQQESPDYRAADYEEKFLAVDGNALTYMLINAVKEQQQMIKELTEKVAKLEK